MTFQKLVKILFPIYILTVLVLLIMPTDGANIDLNIYFLGIRTDHYIHATLFSPFLIFCALIFPKRIFLICLFLGIAFCSLCETLHYFLPYRQFSIEDFYANLSGLSIGALFYLRKGNRG